MSLETEVHSLEQTKVGDSGEYDELFSAISQAEGIGHIAVGSEQSSSPAIRNGEVFSNEGLHMRGAIRQLSGTNMLRVDLLVPRIHH